MASIRDIAREVGVSVSTVSYALSGRRPVSEATRKRVREAVGRLGYRPDARGRNLAAMRAGVVGVVAPALKVYFTAPLLSGIDLALRSRGYRLLLAHMDAGDSLDDLFEKGQVDGLIVLASVTPEAGWQEEWADRVRGADLPCVVVNRMLPGLCCVRTDYPKGATEAVEHLISHRHRRIGFVGEDPADPTQVDLLEGYRRTLRRHGIEPDGSLVASCSAEALERWSVPGGRPTAAFVAGQYHTFPFYRLVRERGLRIPEDIAVVGFDDDTNEADLWPALTTVAQPHGAVSREAVRLLLDGIGGRNFGGGQYHMPPRLVVRNSCGCGG